MSHGSDEHGVDRRTDTASATTQQPLTESGGTSAGAAGQARFADAEAAEAAVLDAEHQGVEASQLHIEAEPQRGRAATRSNDRANLRAASRPAMRWSALAAAAAAVALFGIGALVGASDRTVVVLVLGGAIVGLVLGALAGLYSHLAINRDVIDLRGRAGEGPVVVRREAQPQREDEVAGVRYGDEERDASSAQPAKMPSRTPSADEVATRSSAASFPASDAPATWASEPGSDPVPSQAPGLLRPHTERTADAADPHRHDAPKAGE